MFNRTLCGPGLDPRRSAAIAGRAPSFFLTWPRPEMKAPGSGHRCQSPAQSAFAGRGAGRLGGTSLARLARSAVKLLRNSSTPLRPLQVTADRAGRRLSRRAGRPRKPLWEPSSRRESPMFYISIAQAPGAGPDRVYVASDRAPLHREFAGRSAAVAWLIAQGCCPGAAAMLHDCRYTRPYNINDPADRRGRGAAA